MIEINKNKEINLHDEICLEWITIRKIKINKIIHRTQNATIKEVIDERLLNLESKI